MNDINSTINFESLGFSGQQIDFLQKMKHDVSPLVPALKTVSESMQQSELQPFLKEITKRLQDMIVRLDNAVKVNQRSSS